MTRKVTKRAPRSHTARIPNTNLTSAQERVWEYIRQRITTDQVPPTRQEIATMLGVSSAMSHIQALVTKGYITITPGSARNIRITPQHQTSTTPNTAPAVEIPLDPEAARRAKYEADLIARRALWWGDSDAFKTPKK